ncbi:DUF4245 domain-containing protein [Actinocorallia sp. A-T 12471]|uniref:DUF4245 domain-containing protein n=1 Tax=Actinocorallia sp. A-T 12471 TaxID=3089813 RepID=UPI0029D290BF|nr:DUF4245 domain-containing protein [Actinocorallia sp. A-T 12471]MDX6738595.1 DUF4245 domain-containing protein [Actinocorallia sp. A-T 12471]
MSAPRTETRVVSEGFLKRYLSGPGQFWIAIAACFAFAAAAWVLTPGSVDDAEPKTVEYSFDAKGFARAADFAVFVPENLPSGWYANASRVTGVGEKDAALTWHLGFATPSGAHAALVQSDERPDGDKGFVRRMTNVPRSGSEPPAASRVIDGSSWGEYFQKDKNQSSLVLRLPASTVVVTGTASFAELTVLADALKAQPIGGEG